MQKALQWLVSRYLILAAIAPLIGMGCTDNLSSNQPVENPDVPALRRTRERQGTAYYNTSALSSSKNNLPKLTIGVLSTQTLTEQEQMIQPLDEYLEQSLGRKVDFLIAKNYQEIENLLLQNKLDLAYLGTVTYLEAVEKGAKIQPLATAIDKHTGQPWYRACIIVKANSSIKTLKDLKGKRVAFVDKLSASGYLMPLVSLKKLGINPEQDFAEVIYAGTHSKSMTALEDGIVDAAATNVSYYFKQQKNGQITPEKYRLIWESAPIPNFPIVVSEKLSPELIQQLKQVFVASPDGIEDILGAESAGYTLVSPDDYTPIQQLRQELNLISIPKK
ncbi:phosphate/phosphite/phosphonate ABC transporter substrate-binding protein [Nostoc sp. TCL26-01]|uniref:substrate-binding domain-containing protein n=1 Tax=Nostoc sp. TCL26-01 TaxID=2576904 RepID=UPI0015BFE37C|nr:phosphate/phosphite/phosphonate ABC transporter substrate-binding protein [Nostoc sp. TCL26-01]QLE54411.1 phosphate/phosphite/phosphonate ABC transporter substrate-binding protein [Nostoc sp. TCL26-01]